jgi:alpha-tubulin suppressor-like RCC1 family protein
MSLYPARRQAIVGLGVVVASATILLLATVSTTSLSASSQPASVSAGGEHTCFRSGGGTLKCWGDNEFGQLGDWSNVDRTTPVDVIGLSSGVNDLSAGSYHTCAVTAAAGIKCWGQNSYGQLGNGSMSNSSMAVDVTGLTSDIGSVSAGYRHTCAVTTVGGVKCWGDNDFGQLGDGSVGDSTTPVDVVGLGSGVAAVSAGYRHTCALTTGGGAKCWGGNEEGQLGWGMVSGSSTPVDVSGLTSGVAEVSAGGAQSCAVTTAGAAKCWGMRLLDGGAVTDDFVPVDVPTLGSGVAAVSSGRDYSCVLLASGGVKCWMFNNYGQLGDGSSTDRVLPVSVSGLTSGVASISSHGNAVRSHTCAVTSASMIRCWGYNASGELGNGTNTGPQLCPLGFGTFPCSSTPVDVSGVGPKPTATPTTDPVGGVASLATPAAETRNSERVVAIGAILLASVAFGLAAVRRWRSARL